MGAAVRPQARHHGHALVLPRLSDRDLPRQPGTCTPSGPPPKGPTARPNCSLRKHSQGEKFCLRYDPNSLLYISKAMDLFDLSIPVGATPPPPVTSAAASDPAAPTSGPSCERPGAAAAAAAILDDASNRAHLVPPPIHLPANEVMDLQAGMARITAPALIIGVQSDLLFPCWQHVSAFAKKQRGRLPRAGRAEERSEERSEETSEERGEERSEERGEEWGEERGPTQGPPQKPDPASDPLTRPCIVSCIGQLSARWPTVCARPATASCDTTNWMRSMVTTRSAQPDALRPARCAPTQPDAVWFVRVWFAHTRTAGHDTFLIDVDNVGPAIRGHLQDVLEHPAA